jgi:hypothetical protein
MRSDMFVHMPTLEVYPVGSKGKKVLNFEPLLAACTWKIFWQGVRRIKHMAETPF